MAVLDSTYSPVVSAFMSQKYRQLAGLPGASGGAVLGEDSPCESCGYDLRGLRRGSACPECGAAIPLGASSTGRRDPFLALDVPARGRVRLGATLAAAGLLIVAVEPVASLIFGVLVAMGGIGGGGFLPIGVRGVRLLACVLWIVAGLLAAPAGLWDHRRVLGSAARLPILGLLAGWGIAQGLMIIVMLDAANRPMGAPPPGWIELLGWLAAFLRLLGGLAAAAVLFVLARAAEDAELEPHADRLMAGVFVLPVMGLVIWMIPNTMPWFAALPYLLVFLLPWAWFAWRAGTGLLGVAGHVAWATRIGEQAAGRDERIAAKRAVHDAAVRRQVRPVPGAAGRRSEDVG